MKNDNIARLLKRKDKCWTVEVNLSALEGAKIGERPEKLNFSHLSSLYNLSSNTHVTKALFLHLLDLDDFFVNYPIL